MILKLFKTVEQKNVNVFKIKRFKPVQNTINFLLATKFLPAQIYVFSQNYRAVDCSPYDYVFENLSKYYVSTFQISDLSISKTTPSFFWLHQDSFGILKAQDQIYFISIGIGQEKLDPNHQKMTKRVNEDLYEYHSKIHQNSYYLIVNVTKVTRTFLVSIYT